MHSPPQRRPAEAADSVDAAGFKAALGAFVTGVTVITARSPSGVMAGVTVSSFNTLSLTPPLVLWSISLLAPSLKVFRESIRFSVNVLAEDQGAIALQFSRPSADKFEGVATIAGLGGVPLIVGSSAHIECLVEQRYPGGDHELVIGQVSRVQKNDRLPLVYFNGRFGQFSGDPVDGVTRS